MEADLRLNAFCVKVWMPFRDSLTPCAFPQITRMFEELLVFGPPKFLARHGLRTAPAAQPPGTCFIWVAFMSVIFPGFPLPSQPTNMEPDRESLQEEINNFQRPPFRCHFCFWEGNWCQRSDGEAKVTILPVAHTLPCTSM